MKPKQNEDNFADDISKYSLWTKMTTFLFKSYPDSKVHGPTWGPHGSCQPQMGHMLAPWTWLSGPVVDSDSQFVSTGSGNSVAQVITWTTADEDVWRRHMVSLGHNEKGFLG